jgi:hypothetical protein
MKCLKCTIAGTVCVCLAAEIAPIRPERIRTPDVQLYVLPDAPHQDAPPITRQIVVAAVSSTAWTTIGIAPFKWSTPPWHYDR